MGNEAKRMLKLLQPATRDIEAVRGFPGTSDGSEGNAVCTEYHIYECSVFHNAVLLFQMQSLYSSFPDQYSR